jgi:LmbE family N-acetylglucosaminyl deacetylase
MYKLFALFAHPDDETFRPGGTLALSAYAGVKVYVLTLTHGEAGSCGDPPLCTPVELPQQRANELECACRILGLQPPRLLHFPDGGLESTGLVPLLEQVQPFVDQIEPQVMLSFGADGLSGHPDHIMAGRVAAESYHRSERVAALYQLAVPLSQAQRLRMRQVLPVPDSEIDLSVDVGSVWEIKAAAMRCHATQSGSTPMLKAPEEQQRMFFGVEHFVRAGLRNSADDFIPVLLKDNLKE